MAYKDFSMKHYEQLKKDNEEARKENIELREKLNQKDKEIIEKDNLLFNQNVRLKNNEDSAIKAQKRSGAAVGHLNKILNPQGE